LDCAVFYVPSNTV